MKSSLLLAQRSLLALVMLNTMGCGVRKQTESPAHEPDSIMDSSAQTQPPGVPDKVKIEPEPAPETRNANLPQSESPVAVIDAGDPGSDDEWEKITITSKIIDSSVFMPSSMNQLKVEVSVIEFMSPEKKTLHSIATEQPAIKLSFAVSDYGSRSTLVLNAPSETLEKIESIKMTLGQAWISSVTGTRQQAVVSVFDQGGNTENGQNIIQIPVDSFVANAEGKYEVKLRLLAPQSEEWTKISDSRVESSHWILTRDD